MTAHNKIVVGYDGSPLADLALDWAVDTAGRTHAKIEVIVAKLPFTEPAWVLADSSYKGRMHEVALHAEERLDTLEFPDATLEEPDGDVVALLCAAGETADMVVVGAVGHNALEAGMIGSVSRHLAVYAPCTVVTVRPALHSNPRIVVGVDAGESSIPALRFAMARAADLRAPVVAIHGWKPDRWLAVETYAEQVEDRNVDQAQRLLSEVTAGLAAEFPDVELSTEAIPVRPSRVLRDASDSASLVVVGSRGRSPFKRLLLGSVSQDVLHFAHCPVAIVR